MGLFDSLPPAKAALKREPASLADGTAEEGSAKKPRQDDRVTHGADAESGQQQHSSGSGGGTAAWTGSVDAAFSEDKGSRLTMEDVAVIDVRASPPSAAACRLAFFAIFDGHGGSNVARFAAERLHAAVLAAGLQQEAERLSAAAAGGAASGMPPASLKQCKAAVAEGFRELDRRVLEQCGAAGWQDGCTAVAAWVVGNAVLVANVGDARCVLARRRHAGGESDSSGQQPGTGKRDEPGAAGVAGQGGCGAEPPPLKAITLTREHKAIYPLERQRIEKAGSFVSADGRLAGRVEVSRAFGDRAFKKLGMSAVPDVQAFTLGERDAFLLLACDGFWGVFSPQDAVDFAQRELRGKGNSVKQTCNRLIYEAIRERNCRDNCTVMLVTLGAAGGGDAAGG